MSQRAYLASSEQSSPSKKSPKKFAPLLSDLYIQLPKPLGSRRVEQLVWPEQGLGLNEPSSEDTPRFTENSAAKSSADSNYFCLNAPLRTKNSSDSIRDYKSESEIIAEWIRNLLQKRNLLGTHWENSFAQKKIVLMKDAFSRIKSEYQCDLLQTQSRHRTPKKYRNPFYGLGLDKFDSFFSKFQRKIKRCVFTQLRLIDRLRYEDDLALSKSKGIEDFEIKESESSLLKLQSECRVKNESNIRYKIPEMQKTSTQNDMNHSKTITNKSSKIKEEPSHYKSEQNLSKLILNYNKIRIDQYYDSPSFAQKFTVENNQILAERNHNNKMILQNAQFASTSPTQFNNSKGRLKIAQQNGINSNFQQIRKQETNPFESLETVRKPSRSMDNKAIFFSHRPQKQVPNNNIKYEFNQHNYFVVPSQTTQQMPINRNQTNFIAYGCPVETPYPTPNPYSTAPQSPKMSFSEKDSNNRQHANFPKPEMNLIKPSSPRARFEYSSNLNNTETKEMKCLPTIRPTSQQPSQNTYFASTFPCKVSQNNEINKFNQYTQNIENCVRKNQHIKIKAPQQIEGGKRTRAVSASPTIKFIFDTPNMKQSKIPTIEDMKNSQFCKVPRISPFQEQKKTIPAEVRDSFLIKNSPQRLLSPQYTQPLRKQSSNMFKSYQREENMMNYHQISPPPSNPQVFQQQNKHDEYFLQRFIPVSTNKIEPQPPNSPRQAKSPCGLSICQPKQMKQSNNFANNPSQRDFQPKSPLKASIHPQKIQITYDYGQRMDSPRSPFNSSYLPKEESAMSSTQGGRSAQSSGFRAPDKYFTKMENHRQKIQVTSAVKHRLPK